MVAVAFGVACGLKSVLPPASMVSPRGQEGTLVSKGEHSLVILQGRLLPQLGVPSVGGEPGQVEIWWRWGIFSPTADPCLPSHQWSTQLLWQDRPRAFQFKKK